MSSQSPALRAGTAPRRRTRALLAPAAALTAFAALAAQPALAATSGHASTSASHSASTSPSSRAPAAVPVALRAAGTGHSQYSGTVALGTFFNGSLYELHDKTRGGQKTYDMRGSSPGAPVLFTDPDNTWGDGTARNRQTAAVDAHYGAAVTWDFYRAAFGRSGPRGDGRGVNSRVHAGLGGGNAYWSDACGCVTYEDTSDGRPFISLDIVGHEIAHGLTAATANFLYSGEPGGLNEATSDMLATAGEFFADNPADPGDYLIGEQIHGSALRRMDRPSSDGRSPDYWSKDLGGMDPHYSSGPAVHFFYLLAEGSGPKVINGVAYDSPTYDGSKLLGIGRDAATRIWYHALTTYMTSTTNYAKARSATLAAAAALYGTGSPQVNVVAATWAAVNVK
ncbi:M4 family metallopeptidase [Streptomyces sp. NPDC093225]|uniref:M4 family metallopeptidase n=1 Tax=Streptomyces sp. NPDC093225 TaxID=3366034 RepID=UPI003803F3FA